jgi:hypothetical protein
MADDEGCKAANVPKVVSRQVASLISSYLTAAWSGASGLMKALHHRYLMSWAIIERGAKDCIGETVANAYILSGVDVLGI